MATFLHPALTGHLLHVGSLGRGGETESTNCHPELSVWAECSPWSLPYRGSWRRPFGRLGRRLLGEWGHLRGNRVVSESKSERPWRPIPKMAAHPQDGGPAGRLSCRMDRPLHHVEQLVPEPLCYMSWSITETGVFRWCTSPKSLV